MPELRLHPALFQGKTVHTLTIDGRPAWIARQVGDVLGYANGGKRLVGKITLDWADDFEAGKDFALLGGDGLAAVKAELGLAPSVKGLVVLFESGLHMALIKTHMPLGRALRRFLVDEVLPQLARTGAYVPEAAAPVEVVAVDAATLREARLGARVDLEDRQFRSAELKRTADLLRMAGRIDTATWARCLVAACEIALGHGLPGLHDDPDPWSDVDAVALSIGVDADRVREAAAQLGLFDERPGLSRPIPVRDEGGRWTVAFVFSAPAVAQIDGWLAETSDERRQAAEAA